MRCLVTRVGGLLYKVECVYLPSLFSGKKSSDSEDGNLYVGPQMSPN